MADNVPLNPGAGPKRAATDEVTYSGETADVQLVRIVDVAGAEGSKTVSSRLGLTDAELRAAAVPVSASTLPLPAGAATQATLATVAGTVRATDTPFTNGDPGILMLAKRRDADSTTVSSDGDYTTLNMDESGRLKVSTQPASYALGTGSITANAQTVFLNVDRASNVTISMVATSLVGHNATFEYSHNSTNGTDGNWYGVQVARSNANTAETTTGVLAATPAYGWEVSVNAYKWIRIRATAHTSGTAAYTITPGSYATEPVPVIQTHAVTGSGNFNTAAQAGTNLSNDVGLQVRANATGAASIHHIVSAATTNVAQIKATAGRVLGYCLSNTTASWRYVKLHNVASATAGAAVAMTIGIPPNGKAQCNLAQGIGFATAISRSIVTGSADADATATAVGDVVGDIFFA